MFRFVQALLNTVHEYVRGTVQYIYTNVYRCKRVSPLYYARTCVYLLCTVCIMYNVQCTLYMQEKDYLFILVYRPDTSVYKILSGHEYILYIEKFHLY
jgi:hypothetical protein